MRIVFFGSDDFAVTNLQELIASKHQVVACVTQPDKKKGRGLEMAIPAVKEISLQYKIPTLQPDDLLEDAFVDKLRNYQSDLFVVVAYGKILPEKILAIPKIFSVNIHGSLLPKYRGAAPINWAIINGENKTGISLIKMNSQMDAGDIIAQKEIEIKGDDTSITLRAKMAAEGSKLLVETLSSLENNTYTLTKQEAGLVTYAPKLTKEHGQINWNNSAVSIDRLIRGTLPWPTAFTFFKGKILKILQAQTVENTAAKFQAGEVTAISKEGLMVSTGQGALLIKKVHLESSKPMDAKSFAVGHQLSVGILLGKH